MVNVTIHPRFLMLSNNGEGQGIDLEQLSPPPSELLAHIEALKDRMN